MHATITSFTVPTLTDPGRAAAIRSALDAVDGVAEVVVNLPARLVQVEYDGDRTEPEAMRDVIQAAGFRVQRYSDGQR